MKFNNPFLRKQKKEEKESFETTLTVVLFLRRELEAALAQNLIPLHERNAAEQNLLDLDWEILQIEESAKKDPFAKLTLTAAKLVAEAAPLGQKELVLLSIRGK